MTRLADLERHRHSLAEIREILESMKTLSYMETRKLERMLDAQSAVVEGIEEAAADLLAAWPDILPETPVRTLLYVLLGTERGFCGDFNHAILRRLESETEAQTADQVRLIAVGRRLAPLLAGDARLLAATAGASVAEEVPRVLQSVVDEVMRVQQPDGGLAVRGVYCDNADTIAVRRLLPPFRPPQDRKPVPAHPPVLNESPRANLAGLAEHHVFAALHAMLYTSLWAENSRRVAHLEGAVRHLDDQSAALTRRSHALRQEEIVEEIEVMLLSADDALTMGNSGRKS